MAVVVKVEVSVKMKIVVVEEIIREFGNINVKVKKHNVIYSDQWW